MKRSKSYRTFLGQDPFIFKAELKRGNPKVVVYDSNHEKVFEMPVSSDLRKSEDTRNMIIQSYLGGLFEAIKEYTYQRHYRGYYRFDELMELADDIEAESEKIRNIILQAYEDFEASEI